MDERDAKVRASKKKWLILAVVLFVGCAGGMLTERNIHLVQDKKSGHVGAEHNHMH